MSEMPIEALEARLRLAAQDLPYPPTPDIARAVTHRLAAPPARRPVYRRRLAWALALLIVVLAGLLAVPTVRAQIVEFLQLGVVRIFLVAPTETPTATPLPTPPAQSLAVSPVPDGPSRPTPALPPTATAQLSPTATPLTSILDLAGETTLKKAQAELDFSIRLPSYPPDLGPPDLVFLQDQAGDVVILVWLDPDHSGRVLLSLQEFASGTPGAEKWQPQVIENTQVNGRPALWTTGPYTLVMRNGEWNMRRLIVGHVLVWVEGEITYRLETNLEMEEAVRIAESLQPGP